MWKVFIFRGLNEQMLFGPPQLNIIQLPRTRENLPQSRNLIQYCSALWSISQSSINSSGTWSATWRPSTPYICLSFLPSLSSEDRENMPIGVGQLTTPEEPKRKDQPTTAPKTSVMRRGWRLPRFPLEDAPQVDVGRWETWTFWRVGIQRVRCGNICRDVNTPHLFFTPFHEGLREQSDHKDRGTWCGSSAPRKREIQEEMTFTLPFSRGG